MKWSFWITKKCIKSRRNKWTFSCCADCFPQEAVFQRVASPLRLQDSCLPPRLIAMTATRSLLLLLPVRRRLGDELRLVSTTTRQRSSCSVSLPALTSGSSTSFKCPRLQSGTCWVNEDYNHNKYTTAAGSLWVWSRIWAFWKEICPS